jgi:uncharacterized protein GlcG (DUF336 family)
VASGLCVQGLWHLAIDLACVSPSRKSSWTFGQQLSSANARSMQAYGPAGRRPRSSGESGPSGMAGQSWFQSLIVSTQDRIMAVAGGLPVPDSPHVVGAVGVSGGTAEHDQEGRRAAVAAY